MGFSEVKNAEKILNMLDGLLEQPVELTLYGRAALSLGFPDSPDEYAWSKDVDGVLWIGQAEELAACTNFWAAQEEVNTRLQEQGLFITHLFEEDQVVLRPVWRDQKVAIEGSWKHLRVFRLHDLDLMLSKMMRNDPVDRQDLLFIFDRSGCSGEDIQQAIKQARIPDVPEIKEQFERTSQWFIEHLLSAGK
jgi:hypothetical protein